MTKDMSLPKPIFIRENGDLACRKDQAIVPLSVGDYILDVSGPLPPSLNNPDMIVEVYIVKEIHLEDADVLPVSDVSIPEEVWNQVSKGLNTYHNRDGGWFVQL